jgi:hypothetical protein
MSESAEAIESCTCAGSFVTTFVRSLLSNPSNNSVASAGDTAISTDAFSASPYPCHENSHVFPCVLPLLMKMFTK